MTLLAMQRRMAADIMRPLTASDGLASEARAEYIKPNDRLTSRERLEIYSRSYWYRLIDSLYEDFPGLRAVLGQRAFDRLIRAYLADCPSRSFTMRDLGSRLEPWLRRNPRYAGKRLAPALDMACLEWAHIEAWDSPGKQALQPEDLVGIAPHFRVGLQPFVRLLALQFPVDELRLRVKSAAESSGTLRSPSRRKPNPYFLAVHRFNLSVFYKPMSAEEFYILQAIRCGRTIAEAIENAAGQSSMDLEQFGRRIEEWFAKWAELGWFCRPSGLKR